MSEIKLERMPEHYLEEILESLARKHPGQIELLRSHIAYLEKRSAFQDDVVAVARRIAEIEQRMPDCLLSLAHGVRQIEGCVMALDSFERENTHA